MSNVFAALFAIAAVVAGVFGIASARHLAAPSPRTFSILLGRGANSRRELYTARGWQYRNISVICQTIALVFFVAFALSL